MSKPLSDEDFMRVKNYISNPNRQYAKRDLLILMIGGYTGFRISEILSLTIGSIMKYPPKFNKMISIPKSKMKGKKVSRSVILNLNLQPYINDYFDNWVKLYGTHQILVDKNNPLTPLFPSRKTNKDDLGNILVKGIGSQSIENLFVNIGKELQIEKFSTHSMRKTFAEACYDNFDHDLLKLQSAMGHQAVTSTSKYITFKTRDVIDEGVLAINLEFENKEEKKI